MKTKMVIAVSVSLFACVGASTAEARPGVELETVLSGQITVPYGAGVGYNVGAPGFGTLVGLGLGTRAVIMTGLNFGAGAYEGQGMTYGRSFQDDTSNTMVGNGWSLGADWRAGLLFRI